jgi:antitoxin (DNA-binding transcriptional repressor) of toxin-antitoxin stability system
MTNIAFDATDVTLSTLIEKLESGEEVVITRDEKPIAKLVPVEETEGQPAEPKRVIFGLLAGKLTLDDSFFDPLPEEELKLWEGR